MGDCLADASNSTPCTSQWSEEASGQVPMLQVHNVHIAPSADAGLNGPVCQSACQLRAR